MKNEIVEKLTKREEKKIVILSNWKFALVSEGERERSKGRFLANLKFLQEL